MNPTATDLFKTEHPQLERFFGVDVRNFVRQLSELDTAIPSDAMPGKGDAFHDRVLRAFQESQAACRQFEAENSGDAALILDAQERFRSETDAWFGRSWIAHRARTKPSGFAGDFDMLIKLYDEATPARGLGGYLDLCILELPLARAVRARLQSARQFLAAEVAGRRGGVRILDIACGPCREYQDWPVQPPGSPTIEIVAMDSDPLALDFVEQKVASAMPAGTSLHPVRYNALRTRSAAATMRKFGGEFDIIYSVGLCDYLSDEHLISMLSGWRDTLGEGGTLYVAFKDTERYDKTPYQWHLDWFFFQRTLQDVMRLYADAGFDTDQMMTTRDDTGIIINFIAPSEKRTGVRTDWAHDSVRPPSGLQPESPKKRA